MNSFTLCTCSLFLVSKSTWRSRHWRSWSSRMRYISTAWQGVNKWKLKIPIKSCLCQSVITIYQARLSQVFQQQILTQLSFYVISSLWLKVNFSLIVRGGYWHNLYWPRNILVPDFDQKWFTIRKIALPQCCMCWKCTVYTHKSCPVLSLQYCGCWHQRT